MASKRSTGSKSPSLAARLDAWTRAFSKRTDVVVKDHKRGRPWKGAPQSILAKGEIDQFYTENNGFSFHWVFAELGGRKRAGGGASLGLPGGGPSDADLAPGGVLNIVAGSGTKVLWYPDSGNRAVKGYIQAMMLDEPCNENNTLLVRRYVAGSRKQELVIVSDDANDMSTREFPSLEAYLAEGAKSAFAWYWQQGSRSGQLILDALRARSTPGDTPREAIVERLVARGLSRDEADALCVWLGADARLLLEADAPTA